MRYGQHHLLSQRLRIPAKALKYKLVCIFLAFTQATAGAADSDPIRLATRPNLPPYITQDATKGIEIDLIRAIFEKAGLTPKFVQMDRVAMIDQFERGNIEGSLTQGPAATGHGCITNWYIVHQNVAFTLRKQNMPQVTLEDLGKMAVVSFDNAKTFLGKSFDAAVKNNSRYKEVAPQSAHIGLLYRGEVDAIVGDEWILRDAQRQHFEKTGDYQELDIHQIMPPTLYSARFQNQKTCDNFDGALNGLRLSGAYDQIVNQHHQKILVASQRAQNRQ